MALPAVATANLQCSFGTAPSTLVVLPVKQVLAENKPLGTINDNKPFVNILPFATCMSLANPVTAAQTASAAGVLTPGACIPVFPAPWVPPVPTVLVGGEPALSMDAKCICAYGGVVSILNPGTTTTMVP